MFKCFYCGKDKPDTKRSDEHIIPSCIGGNRNVTLTNNVCGGAAGCNGFMGRYVDQPFCRDWFIEAIRLLLGLKHRGKRPVAFMGTVGWHRPERAGFYLLERGATVIHIIGNDGMGRLVILLDPSDHELVEIVKKAIKSKFAGLPIINTKPPGQDPYNDGLVNDLRALGNQYNLTNTIDVTAWHREVVKMALGLACQALGAAYVASADADLLRSFLREHDPARRATIPIRGHVGIGEHTEPTLTKAWHPGDNEHLFALIETTDGQIAFAANLFGKFENIVVVSNDRVLLGILPGTKIKGVCWIVNPETKLTTLPVPLESVIRRPIIERIWQAFASFIFLPWKAK